MVFQNDALYPHMTVADNTISAVGQDPRLHDWCRSVLIPASSRLAPRTMRRP